MTGTVLYERDGHVARLTLNRPEALNAVNAALADELGGLLERAVADDAVRAIVVTGAGRAFCAGADLKEIAAGRSIAPTAHSEWGFAGLAQHWVSKPLIAAVNAGAMDAVFASADAAEGATAFAQKRTPVWTGH